VNLSGANTLPGQLRVVDGLLSYTGLQALGGASSIFADDASFSYTGDTAVVVSTSIEVGSSGVTLGSDSQVGSLELSGPISGSGLVRAGGYKLLLSGTNTFTGGLSINSSGVVRFTSDDALGRGSIFFSAGTLEPTFDWMTTKAISPNGNARFSTGMFDVQWNGPVGGRGALWKEGTGSLTMRDTDQYFGDVHVQQGTVRIGGPLGNDHSGFGDHVYALEGTVLEGNGDWDRILSVNGILAPGPGIESIEVNELGIGPTGTIQFELASATSFDKLLVTGPLSFADANLDLELSFDPTDFVDSFLLISAGSITPGPGGSTPLLRYGGAELKEGSVFFVDSQPFRISYQAGDGNDIAVSAVPEPSVPTLAALALMGIFGRRRLKDRGDSFSEEGRENLESRNAGRSRKPGEGGCLTRQVHEACGEAVSIAQVEEYRCLGGVLRDRASW
jgi:autotransporter-associated beta strand protein